MIFEVVSNVRDRSYLHATASFVSARLATFALLALCGVASAANLDYHVYVTNEGSGDVTVIDGRSNGVVKTLPLGKRPRGIAASADGKRLFVALSGSPLAGPGIDEESLPPADKTADGIGVLEIESGRVERVLRGVSDPEQLVVDRAGTRLFVASEDTGKAIIIDLGSGRVAAAVDVGGEPEGVALSSSRTGLLCVTSESDNTVAFVDVAQHRVLQRVAVGQRPRDAEFSPDDSALYVSGENDGSLSVVDVATRRVVRKLSVPGAGARPKGVAVSADGRRVYVTTGRGGQVVVYDAKNLAIIGTVAVGGRPWGVALSPDGRYLYTANGPANNVAVIDTLSLTLVATINAGDRPWGVAVVPARPAG
jgi:YVTN family beta-propeller protein